MTAYDKLLDKLVIQDIERQALERAAQKLESQIFGDAYSRAFAKAAKMIREMKPA